MKPIKPLGGPAYGSIPHLPGSTLGPGDHHIHEGQARILTDKVRDKSDRIIVTEKFDGTCVSVARIGDEIVPLIRAGYTAANSHYQMHHKFDAWVRRCLPAWKFLLPGERLCGEWMLIPHGTIYHNAPLFIPFDLIGISGHRLPWFEVDGRLPEFLFDARPKVLACEPCDPAKTHGHLGAGQCAAETAAEGLVYRCERGGRVEFLAKWVRPDFIPGKYLDKSPARFGTETNGVMP